MQIFRLDGQTAFVTGAGSGIGQRIAIGLAEAGADIAGFDLPGSKGIGATVTAIEKLGRKAIALAGNVTQADDLARAVDEAEKALGPLQVAINAAGIANAAPAEEMPLDQWQHMLDINLTGIFLSCQAQARVMLPRRRGAIVNIASMSGSIVNRGIQQIHYNTSKAGVVHLTKSLAMEWVDRGIRVNAISPGYTSTPMNLRPEVAEQVKRFEAETPMGRMALVDEMVGPAVFLASAAASFVTGVDLLVDGGFECW
ncbi:short chain dehydrogenase [Labrys miyagiensis]|uniref:Short chain dehydrogenase n=1 Tax=Labrys miyagiensis TaxID=346912 RepID=A0ABQ6CN29_9HYPH|nr:SDR family oxidoreductase [Labrys miyagiensis]GLS21753.1 short chain dehydrogenase [Labrys miyagiensis]